MPLAALVNQNFPNDNTLLWPDAKPENATYGYSFINFFRFLSGTCAPMGVRLRANHTGSVANGGMNYYIDSFKPHGENAWALFEFTQASPPFWLYIWYTHTFFASSSAGPANPAMAEGVNNNVRGLFMATAVREDGLSPWNGTTASNGQDTKGNPVWISGSSSLCVFPRSNNPGGAQAVSRENCASFFSSIVENTNDYDPGNSAKNPTTFAHFFAGPDWFTTILDIGGTGMGWWHHFGKYIVHPQLSSSIPPYFMACFNGRMANFHGGFDNFLYEFGSFAGFGALNGYVFDATTFGSFAGSDFATDGVSPGGISCPLTSSTSHVRTLIMSFPSIFPYTYASLGPNFAVTGSAWFDEFAPYLYIGESPYGTGSAGFVGHAKDLKFIAGSLQHMSLNAQKTKAALHLFPYVFNPEQNSNYHTMHLSLSVPWTGSILPYHKMSYQGTSFYVP